MNPHEDHAFHDRIVVVLARARNPANIGAAARAMHDLGYARLRVVNAFEVPFAAARSAIDASTVLLEARQPSSIAAAVEDCTLVLGTTAVGERVLEHPLHTIANAATLVRATLETNRHARVALLFGSEKTGLTNEELSHCHALVTIPMNAPGGGRHLSMNLGQAVAICLYALNAAHPEPVARAGPVAAQAERVAPAADAERVTALLREVLEASGYARRNPAGARELTVRRLVRRMQLSADEAPMWTGMLRQILFRLQRGEETSAPDTSSNRNAPRAPPEISDHGER